MEHNEAEGCSSNAKIGAKSRVTRSSGFKVRNLGQVLELAWAQEQGIYDEFCEDEVEEESCGGSGVLKQETGEEQQAEPSVVRRLDLNVVSVADLNAEVTTPIEGSPDEENGCTSEKNELARSNGSGESGPESTKRSINLHDETCDGDSTLINASPLRVSNGLGQLDDNYEYCVKVIRWLECTGHIENDFRMKFLTWFSLRSTEQER